MRLVLKGFYAQELDSEEGGPQQKWKLPLEEAQGCPQTSGILGKTGREKGSGRETLSTHIGSPRSVSTRTCLTN